MPSIKLRNLDNTVLTTKANGNRILDIVHDNGLDWLHACGGKGNCTTCKIEVSEGQNNLSELTMNEKRYLESGLLQNNERLACQALLNGHVEAVVPESGKLPHLTYSY